MAVTYIKTVEKDINAANVALWLSAAQGIWPTADVIDASLVKVLYKDQEGPVGPILRLYTIETGTASKFLKQDEATLVSYVSSVATWNQERRERRVTVERAALLETACLAAYGAIPFASITKAVFTRTPNHLLLSYFDTCSDVAWVTALAAGTPLGEFIRAD